MPDLESVVKILKTAKKETIDEKKCFAVDWQDFLYIADKLTGSTDLFASQALSRRGYSNFELRLTIEDEGTYYVVAKSGPILDSLWGK